MNNGVKVIDILKRNVIPGINLFELILFSFATLFGITLFLLTIFVWEGTDNSPILTDIIVLVDIPIGILAATFLAKRSTLAPLLLSIDALLYGGANIIAGEFALGFVNFVLTPILYLIAFFWIWPKQKNEDENEEVMTRKFTLLSGILISGSAILVAFMFGVIISILGDHSIDESIPEWLFWFRTWFDSFAAALMLMAVIASVLRFREAWYFYFVSNILKIILFSTLLAYGDLSSAELLVLAIAYFINALFGMIIWKDSELININKQKNT